MPHEGKRQESEPQDDNSPSKTEVSHDQAQTIDDLQLPRAQSAKSDGDRAQKELKDYQTQLASIKDSSSLGFKVEIPPSAHAAEISNRAQLERFLEGFNDAMERMILEEKRALPLDSMMIVHPATRVSDISNVLRPTARGVSDLVEKIKRVIAGGGGLGYEEQKTLLERLQSPAVKEAVSSIHSAGLEPMLVMLDPNVYISMK